MRLLKQSRGEEAAERSAAAAKGSGSSGALDSGTATSAAIMQNLNSKSAKRDQNLAKVSGGMIAPP